VTDDTRPLAALLRETYRERWINDHKQAMLEAEEIAARLRDAGVTLAPAEGLREARYAALVKENSRLRHLLAVALDPSEDEQHEWCDVTSDGEHTFDSFSFERDARATLTPEDDR